MAKIRHRNLPATENHPIHAWEVANATAREALVPVASDVGRVARQLDDGSLWALRSISPVAWRPMDQNPEEYSGPAVAAQAGAQAAQAAAEVARNQAIVAAVIKGSTAEGIAAVADGAFFAVPAAAPFDDWLILYQRSGAAAVEKSRSIGSGSVYLAAMLNYAWGLMAGDGTAAVALKNDGTMEIASAEMAAAVAEELTAVGATLAGLRVLERPEFLGYAWAVGSGADDIALGIRLDGTVEVGELLAPVINAARSNPVQPIRSFGAELNHVISYGQSLSIGSAATPPLTTEQRHDSLMFVGGVRPADGGADPAVIYGSLVPLIETTFSTAGETPLGGALESIHDTVLDEDGLAYDDHAFQLLGSACGVSGQPISALDKPGGIYDTLILNVTKGKERATALDKSYKVLAVLWAQGEADTQFATTAATYRALLDQLIIDLNADIKAITGQVEDVHLVGYQFSSWKVFGVGATWEIPLAQLAAHNANPLFRVVGPNYHLPHSGDMVHLTNRSSKRLGAYFGRAIKREVVDGTAWKILQPLSSHVTGKAAVLTFDVPAGPLVFDTETVTAATNYGFELVDSGGGALTISSVTLLGDNRVKVLAAAAIPAGAKVRYAATGAGTTGPVDGPRGNLRDSAGDRAVFAPTKWGWPLHNWCVHFEWTL